MLQPAGDGGGTTGEVTGEEPKTRVLAVLGTRPEIVKMAPVLTALEGRPSVRCTLVHTNQHYDAGLSAAFLRQFEYPEPDVSLGVGSGSQAAQTAEGVTGVARAIREHDVDAVLAQGDTNAVLSTAVAASKRPVPFAHVEAGIRSYDRSMPEEVNRVVADHVADLLFAPTDTAAENLAHEGITDGVHVTGNTVVDACRRNAPIAARESDVHGRLDLAGEEYAVATVHRPGNTDDPDRLERVLCALDERSFPVVLPAHPRTTTAIGALGFEETGSLRVVDPLDYLDFLALLQDARVVVTDSGGVQEEASILEVPCFTVRPNTERPETVEAGVNELVEPGSLGRRLATVFRDASVRATMTGEPDLYGDGDSGERIADLLVDAL